MPLTKASFREKCLYKLKNVSKHSYFYRNSMLNNRLKKELRMAKNKKILLYAPLVFEANINKTIAFLRKRNSVLLPFMQRESFKMVPFRLPLKRNRFGIYEAGNSLKIIKNIDIAVVPVVGMDGNFRRVGFGKGMYDRFFSKLKKRPYTIFVQSVSCLTKESPCDDYDIACDIYMSYKKILIRKKNAK